MEAGVEKLDFLGKLGKNIGGVFTAIGNNIMMIIIVIAILGGLVVLGGIGFLMFKSSNKKSL
tara:strand:+ start:2694 stop:2879 length:186 start_codon:yes stop_codon:yes gene_type:complete